MKRIRREEFMKKCACWRIGASSGEWYRFPPEEQHESDRFDPRVGPCILGCKEFPCLHDREKADVPSMMVRELNRIYGEHQKVRDSLPGKKLPCIKLRRVRRA